VTATSIINRMKKRVYDVLAVACPGDKLTRAFNLFLVSLIISNIVAVVLQTVEPCYNLAPRFLPGSKPLR
jgi:hypothetical protein